MSSLMGITGDKYLRVMEICGFYKPGASKKKWNVKAMVQWLNGMDFKTTEYQPKGSASKCCFLLLGRGIYPKGPEEQESDRLAVTYNNGHCMRCNIINQNNINDLLLLCDPPDSEGEDSSYSDYMSESSEEDDELEDDPMDCGKEDANNPCELAPATPILDKHGFDKSNGMLL